MEYKKGIKNKVKEQGRFIYISIEKAYDKLL